MLNLLKRSNPSPESGTVKLGDAHIDFTIVRDKRRKRTIAFQIDAPAKLRITAPTRTSYASIMKALAQNNAWLARRLRAFQKAPQSARPRRYIDGEIIRYLGHDYRLHIICDTSKTQGCSLKPRRMAVTIADDMLSEKAMAEEVKLEIKLWLKKRAKTVLQKRLALWAKKLGLHYKSLSVTGPEKRWGSCSAHNDIRLNWRLVMAPMPLIDYVAVHELCHIAQKNHGPKFWRLVAEAMPDYQDRRKKLRAIGSGLVV